MRRMYNTEELRFFRDPPFIWALAFMFDFLIGVVIMMTYDRTRDQSPTLCWLVQSKDSVYDVPSPIRNRVLSFPSAD